MPIDQTEFLERSFGRLAYRRSEGDPRKASLVWLSGLYSDMQGGKATMLHAAALAQGRPFLRFDYRGHGESDVDFAETCISDWREDALAIIDELIEGPVVLVGSSMGGFVSLLSAMVRPERVRGLVLIAPAPDFPTKLMWPELPPEVQREITDTGFWMRPMDGTDFQYPVTKKLFEDARQWEMMDGPIKLDIPVRILQGNLDDAVPPSHAQKLAELLTTPDVHFHLIKDGDHRLSRPQDLITLRDTALRLAEDVDQVAFSA